MAPVNTGTAQRLLERLRAGLARAALDADLRRRGRWINARCLLAVDNQQVLLDIRQGAMNLMDHFAPLSNWDFALHGSVLAWEHHWQTPPPAGWHDLLALAKRGELRIEGNLQPFMANLQYFKDLLALPRELYEAQP